MKKIFLIMNGFFVLTGCMVMGSDESWIHDHSHDYRSAQEHEKLHVPNNRAVKSETQDYAIPAVSPNVEKKYIDDPVPPGMDLK